MKISDAISKIRAYHNNFIHGQPIQEETTRDKVLFGNPDQELTGVVATCYASMDVIRAAAQAGANLIVCHEALFWNHGDHTDWLKGNKTFQLKRELLESSGIVVWRDHDHIHAGIPQPDGPWTDGIFYGLMETMGWRKYLCCDPANPCKFRMPATTVRALSQMLMDRLDLNGIKIIGSPDSPVETFWIPGHIMGRDDNSILQTMEEEDIDALITLECIDFTVAEFVRDSTMAGRPKTILALGHFNAEEPGMRYMALWLPQALGPDVSCRFIPSTDMYNFLTRQARQCG